VLVAVDIPLVVLVLMLVPVVLPAEVSVEVVMPLIDPFAACFCSASANIIAALGSCPPPPPEQAPKTNMANTTPESAATFIPVFIPVFTMPPFRWNLLYLALMVNALPMSAGVSFRYFLETIRKIESLS
jgi:hypothetical protein